MTPDEIVSRISFWERIYPEQDGGLPVFVLADSEDYHGRRLKIFRLNDEGVDEYGSSLAANGDVNGWSIDPGSALIFADIKEAMDATESVLGWYSMGTLFE
jgi:hypothetical protein